MANDKRGVDRMLQRGSTRVLSRTVHTLPEAVERLERRADGAALTRAPLDVEVVARVDGDTNAPSGRDMRSEIARQIAELATLSAERGMLRAAEVQRSEATGGGQAEDQGESSAFQDWYNMLAAKGLKQPEIEELMLDHLRGLRRGMLAMDATRKVGR